MKSSPHTDEIMEVSILEVAAVLLVLVTSVTTILAAEDGVGGIRKNLITWKDLEVEDLLDWGDLVIVVRQDGLGDSTTVQGAVDMVPIDNHRRVKIYIYPGIYREKVYVPSTKPYVSLIGKIDEAPIIITSASKSSDRDFNGNVLGLDHTATLFVQSDYFCATSITIENGAIPDGKIEGNQAVALRVDGDKAMFYRIRMLGYQDTLWDNVGTHYFYHCFIQGGVDFICGKARSLYQECTINSTIAGAIAAHQREEEDEETGFSFVGCKIEGIGPTLLGRAWGNHSRIVYSYCNIDDIIDPVGWNDWNIPSRQQTSTFGEYMCEGGGSNRTGRAKWSLSLKDDQAMPFLGKDFIKGHSWLGI